MKKNTLTIEKLVELVTAEATKLREVATKEELDNLDFKSFNPIQSDRCIYGQMTGDCDSDRSIKLIKECNLRVMSDRDYYLKDVHLNGKPTSSKRLQYFTPIELFIGLRTNLGRYRINQINGNNDILIKFLKNKRIKNLKFKKIDLDYNGK